MLPQNTIVPVVKIVTFRPIAIRDKTHKAANLPDDVIGPSRGGKRLVTAVVLNDKYPYQKKSIQSGKQPNLPLQTVLLNAKHKTDGLPESQSFVQVDKNNVIVSAMKKTDDENNYIIRLYEVAGEDSEITVKLPFTVEKVWKTDMIEENGVEIPAGNNSFTVKMGHHAIETFKIAIKQ